MAKKIIKKGVKKAKLKVKEFLKDSDKLEPASEKSKKRMRAGKIKMKGATPEIQKKIDDLYDKPTDLKIVKPKKMNAGGLAKKGLGKAYINSKR